jgi:hypothetical protein
MIMTTVMMRIRMLTNDDDDCDDDNDDCDYDDDYDNGD